MTGSIIYLNGMPVNWISKKQTTVALSSTEAEVYAMSIACTDAIHLWSFLHPLSPPALPIMVYCDNQGAKCIAEQGSNSVRSKWYDTRVLFLRDWFKTKALRFHYLNTQVNVSDAFILKVWGRLSWMCLDHRCWALNRWITRLQFWLILTGNRGTTIEVVTRLMR